MWHMPKLNYSQTKSPHTEQETQPSGSIENLLPFPFHQKYEQRKK